MNFCNDDDFTSTSVLPGDGLFSSITLIISYSLLLVAPISWSVPPIQTCNNVDTEKLTPSGSSTSCCASPARIFHSLTQTLPSIERCNWPLSVLAGPVFVDSESLRGTLKLQLPDDVATATGMPSLNYSRFYYRCIYPFGFAIASIWRHWRVKNLALSLENNWSLGIT